MALSIHVLEWELRTMDKKEYTYLDSSNVEHVVSISKEDFKLNQKDKSTLLLPLHLLRYLSYYPC